MVWDHLCKLTCSTYSCQLANHCQLRGGSGSSDGDGSDRDAFDLDLLERCLQTPEPTTPRHGPFQLPTPQSLGHGVRGGRSWGEMLSGIRDGGEGLEDLEEDDEEEVEDVGEENEEDEEEEDDEGGEIEEEDEEEEDDEEEEEDDNDYAGNSYTSIIVFHDIDPDDADDFLDMDDAQWDAVVRGQVRPSYQ